jgi:two-component system, NarL family, response regulator LiaR
MMAPDGPIRVMIVDDHAMVRGGLRLFMLSMSDIVLVAEAADGEEALRACDETAPDVVLMDIVMPGMDGVEATRRIRETHPQVQVLALSSFQEGDYVQRVLSAGAIGYLLKDVSADDLASSIRAAHAGRPSLSPGAATALVHSTTQPAFAARITDRQREVLRLIVEGRTNAQIADELIISIATVRYHVSALFAVLGVDNRAEAAVLAVKHGLVS